MSTLTITDYDYERILTSVGWPVIKETDLNVTADFIKDYLILPPLKNIFFKWFPLEIGYQVSIGTNFDIDFPDDETFGVVDARLVRIGGGATRTGNPLINESIIKVREGGYFNKWASGNDYGYSNVYAMEKARLQSSVSIHKSLKTKVDSINRKLTGYSNIAGDITITWAKYSTNFDDVPHKFHEDVIKLSQSAVLEYFGRLRNQSTSNLPTELDGNDFIDRADELYTEVTTKFKNFTKPILIKT